MGLHGAATQTPALTLPAVGRLELVDVRAGGHALTTMPQLLPKEPSLSIPATSQTLELSRMRHRSSKLTVGRRIKNLPQPDRLNLACSRGGTARYSCRRSRNAAHTSARVVQVMISPP